MNSILPSRLQRVFATLASKSTGMRVQDCTGLITLSVSLPPRVCGFCGCQNIRMASSKKLRPSTRSSRQHCKIGDLYARWVCFPLKNAAKHSIEMQVDVAPLSSTTKDHDKKSFNDCRFRYPHNLARKVVLKGLVRFEHQR